MTIPLDSHAGPSRPKTTVQDVSSFLHPSFYHTDVRPSQLPSLQPEIIVVGAGIAGTAIAYGLASTGRSILLLERDLSEPDRIVGELLQPGGVAALHRLGLQGCLEGIDATPVEGYCVVLGERRVKIPYPMLEKYVNGTSSQTVDISHSPSHQNDTKSNGLHQVVEKEKLSNGHANDNGHVNGNGHSNGNGHPDRNEHPNDLKTSDEQSQTWYVESFSGHKEGRSFHHGRLITSLRQACYSAPNLTVIEATVRDLITCEHTSRIIGVTAAFKSTEPALFTDLTQSTDMDKEKESATTTVVRNIYAPLTIIADGLFSKFRNLPGLKLPTPIFRSHFVGVILKDVSLPIDKYGTVCLTPSGPVLLYQIGWKAREIRMLVDVAGKLPSVADGSLKQHIIDNYLPHLPLELHSAVQDALDTQRLRTMPNSFLPPAQQASSPSSLQGAILIGDAWNMRHPLTGGGMTVAFADAVLLTEYLRPCPGLPEGREGLEDWAVIGERVRKWFWRRKHLAAVVNILSVALYDLFGGANEDLAILREGCFKYFELGGECVAGPVGLLSA
ncbi:squalene monooxygenase [Tremella mesenterica]|uniref:Squalene monooxygenase n=1 Tax=Tremella mesenterica TaxID=5217 RepID=A0A4Q1BL89_TREME|nr:squalene monooxygenase [Tremella mesenterica]